MRTTLKKSDIHGEFLEQLLSPHQVVEKFPNLYSENQLKSLIKSRRYNGLENAVVKIPGRKLMIFLPEFRAWVRSRMAE
jgi:hypothetical protein